MVKAQLKRWLQACAPCWRAYTALKYTLTAAARLRYFLHDARITWRHAYWRPYGAPGLTQLHSELLFNYHKLEKGLCMPGPRRLFGIEPAARIVELLDAWERCGYGAEDPIRRGALDTLVAYRGRLEAHALDPAARVLPAVRNCLARHGRAATEPAPATPIAIDARRIAAAACHATLSELFAVRRSYRNFATRPVPLPLIQEAVAMAQLSPSACNRQPCRVYLAHDEVLKRDLLAFQNGNAGFGHQIPHVAVITADTRCFFDASERHEPFVDGGLFSMSLIYALLSQGVVSCCLNWCVPVAVDRAVHRRFGIPEAERIIMLLALGYPPDDSPVPLSPRKAPEAVLLELQGQRRSERGGEGERQASGASATPRLAPGFSRDGAPP